MGVKLLSPIIVFDYRKGENLDRDIIFLDLLLAGLNSPKGLFLCFGRSLTYEILRLINSRSTVIV